jgi:predicted RNA-binding Zn-ribbon protein involved in translation (DUF1610 family)
MPSSPVHMLDCPDCGTHGHRTHRRGVQRILYSNLYACANCGRRVGNVRTPFRAELGFVFSTHTRCPRCATFRIHRQPRFDRIDWMSWHPLSCFFRLTFAPRHKCDRCRLQFYDWRPGLPLPARRPT